MKKIRYILLFTFLAFNLSAQIFTPTDFYICKRKKEAEKIVRNLDKSGWSRQITTSDDKLYYIELESDDINETYLNRKGKDKLCIPVKKRRKILTIKMFDKDEIFKMDKPFF